MAIGTQRHEYFDHTHNQKNERDAASQAATDNYGINEKLAELGVSQENIHYENA